MPGPTADAIASGSIVEDQGLDFKREVDLADPHKKRAFVDDVVAFLNAGAGRVVVGVAEKAGRFDRFQPLVGDRDATARRFLSIVQDNVRPKPTGVVVGCIEVDGGFLVDVAVPEHGMRPYQNAINGAFLIRTGSKNTPMARDAVHAMFATVETMEADAAKLMEREERAMAARGILEAGGPTLHVAVVPRAHYDRSAAPFEPDRGGALRTFPHYHGHGDVFRGCQGGVEARDGWRPGGRSTSRLFVGDDWLVHSLVAHPFRVTEGEGRLTLHEFGKALPRHLADVQAILDDAGIAGPHCVLMAVRDLRSNPKVEWAFPAADTVSMPRGAVVGSVDDPDLCARFLHLVKRASVYGG